MAITVQELESKAFKVVSGSGYDTNEVEDFLEDLIVDIENREAEAVQMKAQIESLKKELAAAKAGSRTAAAPAAPAAVHTTESFELVLTKAKSAYEEIVAAADARAAEIVAKANEDAASMRANAESQITDLTAKLSALRKQTADYYASLKKAADAHAVSLEQIKKLL